MLLLFWSSNLPLRRVFWFFLGVFIVFVFAFVVFGFLFGIVDDAEDENVGTAEFECVLGYCC